MDLIKKAIETLSDAGRQFAVLVALLTLAVLAVTAVMAAVNGNPAGAVSGLMDSSLAHWAFSP